MNLINKEDDVFGGNDFINGVFDTLFKVTAVFGTGHHTAHIQRNYALVFQQLRHFVGCNLLRQALGNSGFTNTGFTNQAGIVFSAPRQNLDHPLDLFGTTDYRIQLAGFRHFGQILAELIQNRRFTTFTTGSRRITARRTTTSGRAGLLDFAQCLNNIVVDVLRVDAHSHQQPHSHTAGIAQRRQQQMFCADIAMLHGRGLYQCRLHNLTGTRSEIIGGQMAIRPTGFRFQQLCLIIIRGDTSLFQYRCGNTGTFLQQSQHNVLGSDVGMAEFFGRLQRQIQRRIGFFGKSFESIHTSFSLSKNGSRQVCA